MNLMIDKSSASYLHDKAVRRRLSYTQIKDAKVEYFLSKWQVNSDGCIMKVRQSESFALWGKFKENNMHLSLSEDNSKVLLVMDADRNSMQKIALEMWEVQKLKKVPIPNHIQDIFDSLNEWKVEMYKKYDLLSKN